MIIHVFTVATGIYNNYLKYQFNTIQNLFPGVKKTYNVISDKQPDFTQINCNDIISTKYHHITNLPYPLIPLNKFTFIHDVCLLNNYNDNDYFVFIDADTILCDKSNCSDKDIWNKITNDLINYDLSFAYSPIDTTQVGLYENTGSLESCAFIDNINEETGYKYSQTSFLMGNIKALKKLDFDYCNLEAKDLNKEWMQLRILPYMFDQSYCNKIIFDERHDNYTINENFYIYNNYIKIDKFINDDDSIKTDYSEYEDFLSPYCICMQKIDKELKEKYKRNKNTFNINA